MQKNNNKTIPVVVLGAKGVGKTSLIESFGQESFYPPASGVAIDFKMIIYRSVKLQFYDISGCLGEGEFKIVRNQIQNVKTAILAFDLSEQSTFTEFSLYKELISQIQTRNIIFAGCKSDLVEFYDQNKLLEDLQRQGFEVDKIYSTSSVQKKGQNEILNKILEVNKVQIQNERDQHEEGYCCGLFSPSKKQK